MIYRRRTYRVLPEQVDVFTEFFHECLLPNQMKHGARLVGRWVSEARDEVVAIWEYESREEFEQIQERVRADELHRQAQERRRELGELFVEVKEDWLEATGVYQPPKQIVSVSGLIWNDKREILLVRTFWRGDTWEMPGGQVEFGETLDQALVREIWEETGVDVRLHGVTGVYHNQQLGILNVTFCGGMGMTMSL
jgi:8-oxo-dGTP diphosphatase